MVFGVTTGLTVGVEGVELLGVTAGVVGEGVGVGVFAGVGVVVPDEEIGLRAG